MKLELAKDLFRDSWNRRDQLTGSTGTPISVLTAVSGAVAVLVANFEYERGLGTVIFAAAAIVSIAGLIAAACFLARSYHGYVYQELPNAADLDSHCEALHEYHRANGGSVANADADFDSYLATRFIDGADVNSRNNESKAAYLYRATQSLIVGIVFAAIATVPWAVAKFGGPADVQRVIIEAPVRVTLPPEALNAAPPIAKSPAAGSPAATTAAGASPTGATKPSDKRGGAATPQARP